MKKIDLEDLVREQLEKICKDVEAGKYDKRELERMYHYLPLWILKDEG